LDDGSRVVARAVVIASGAFQSPAVPPLAARFAADVQQWTAQTYRKPGQLDTGPVLVVGDGATGRQIALELVAGRPVYLATGRPRRAMPERLLGRNLFWWLDRLGILRAPRDSAVGRYLRESDNFPGKSLSLDNLRRQGAMVASRLVEADDQRVRFADGLTASVAAVVWATGYRDESEWVAIPAVKDGAGRFVERAGVSPLPGLYFIGRGWQRNRGSALLTGVGDDARLLVPEIVRFLAGRPRAARAFSTPPATEPASLAG
jgi:putative flavoprotein involved in K+ transport